MQNPEDFILNQIGKIFVVKPNSIGPPTQYVVNKVSYVTLENGKSAWSFSSLPKRGESPWTIYYRPATETSPDIPPPRSAYYQYLIGII